MKKETLSILLRRAFETGARCVNLDWQGGEPTLAGFDFFTNMVQMVKELKPEETTVTQTLQTNGSLLDERWCRFFAKEGFLIGLSLDGPKEYHDALRVDEQGHGTFQKVLDSARLLARFQVNFNILTVVNGWNARHAGKLYRFFVRNNLKYLQFIPCLDPFGGQQQPYSLCAEDYGRFLIELFRLWEADYREGNYISIRHIDNSIRLLAGFPPEECGTLGRCSLYTVVEADGEVYPCDFYCTDQYALGNIADHSLAELSQTENAKKFLNQSLVLPEDCLHCPYGFLCRGGCRRHRDNGWELGKNRFCQSYQAYYKACLPSMATIARTFR